MQNRTYELDYIFVPCVCFDENGFRVGMGQGYYDHSLDSIDQSQTKLIMILAHEIQKLSLVILKNMTLKRTSVSLTDKPTDLIELYFKNAL